MRTTISLEDCLGEAARSLARAEGMSFSAFIAKVLDDAIKRPEPKQDRPFRLVTVRGGGVREGVDLDRPRKMEVEDDEAAWAKRG